MDNEKILDDIPEKTEDNDSKPVIDIEYIIKSIRVNKGKVRKWRDKEMCGKECSSFVYRYSIIEKRIRAGQR